MAADGVGALFRGANKASVCRDREGSAQGIRPDQLVGLGRQSRVQFVDGGKG